jgi:hypothetical protein
VKTLAIEISFQKDFLQYIVPAKVFQLDSVGSFVRVCGVDLCGFS